jgi:hypothetical protein
MKIFKVNKRKKNNEKNDERHYWLRDVNAQTHSPPATTTAAHENHTGTSMGPTCTAQWLRARTAWRTATMPKIMPETSVY